MDDVVARLEACVADLSSAAASMKAAAAQIKSSVEAKGGEVTKITAAVDADATENPATSLPREQLFDRRLKEAEGALALMVESGTRSEDRPALRKTLPAATVQLLAKQGIDAEDAMDLQSLDTALAGLSIEHRIAVKSQLLRTGALIR